MGISLQNVLRRRAEPNRRVLAPKRSEFREAEDRASATEADRFVSALVRGMRNDLETCSVGLAGRDEALRFTHGARSKGKRRGREGAASQSIRGTCRSRR